MFWSLIYSSLIGCLLGIRSTFTQYPYKRYLAVKTIFSLLSIIPYFFTMGDHLIFILFDYDVSTTINYFIGAYLHILPINMALMTALYWITRLSFLLL